MSGKNSDAMRQRWADPAYRERQTDANRAATKLPRVLSKRKSKMTDTEAALAGWRQRALDAEGLVDTYRAGTAARDARIKALEADNAALQKSESEAWDKAEYYEDVVERLVLYFDCPNPSAIVEHIQALFEMRERTLIDLENWIVAAEPLVPFGLPAAFGQWRRPEK